MKRIVFAVLLSFFGPGLGQIYNRDYRRGVILLLVSTGLFILPAVWLVVRVQPQIPKDANPAVTQQAVQAAALGISKKEKKALTAVNLAFLALWAYSITQAYFRARELNESEPEQRSGTGDGEPLNPE
jgi:TM2 domain-containing membrane protein YozV